MQKPVNFDKNIAPVPGTREALHLVGLISKNDEISTYEKIKLVPFGEFIPFSLPFLKNLNLGNYTPGKKNTIFHINNFNFIIFI